MIEAAEKEKVMKRLLGVLLMTVALAITTGCDEFEIEDVQLSFGRGLSWLLPGYSEVRYSPAAPRYEYVIETYEEEEYWVEETYEEVWIEDEGYSWLP
jgi:hypothetical protein